MAPDNDSRAGIDRSRAGAAGGSVLAERKPAKAPRREAKSFWLKVIVEID
jgi:hypothetical protein